MSRTWKRSDGMSYRDWGRVRKDRALVKDWKTQLTEEEETVAEVTKVFIIVNEWTDIANNASSEVVDAKWFATEDDAWAALNIIAESYGTDLDDDETSLEFEDHKPGLQSEEYYIQELTKG